MGQDMAVGLAVGTRIGIGTRTRVGSLLESQLRLELLGCMVMGLGLLAMWEHPSSCVGLCGLFPTLFMLPRGYPTFNWDSWACPTSLWDCIPVGIV